MMTNSFEEAILRSANLGYDGDTTAAVCGQVAGAFYGAEGIPSGWVKKLAMRDEIDALARALYAKRGAERGDATSAEQGS